MPPLPTVPAAVKVILKGTTSGAAFEHVMHLRYSGNPPLTGDCASVATQVRAAWLTNLGPIHNPVVGIEEVEVIDLASNTGASGTNQTVASGSHAGTALPANVALVVSWHVNTRYRGGHP